MLLRYTYPNSKIYVFGTHDGKLSRFSFADETYKIRHIPEKLRVDHAFECVGGENSGDAINQIIDYINPEGAIALMGVSERNVPINTRMVLEKGLRIFGNSRSGRDDFLGVLDMYTKYPEIPLALNLLLLR